MSEVLRLTYGTPQHEKVKRAILARYNLSKRKMGDKWEAWRKSEETTMAFISDTEANLARQQARDAGVPQQVTFIVPVSYAIMMTAHMYWSTVFLSRNPVLQFSGRHGEGADNEKKVEALIDYQVQVGQHLVPLYVWLMDAVKYGLGVLCSYWTEEQVTVSEIELVPETFLGVPIPGKTKKVRKTKHFPGYVGNKVFNVRPYDFIADPRVPIMELQRGEFAGRVTELGWNEVLRREAADQYFNIDQLKRRRFGVRDTEPGAQPMVMPAPEDQADFGGSMGIQDVGFVPAIEMTIELVPNDWGLGSSKSPEKWFFTLANKEVVICARPTGSFHNKYPFYVQEYEIDGYQLAKRSMLEILQPLNDTVTWLVDLHHTNVRAIINGQFIIDPSKLMMQDVLNPTHGRMWRLRPEAYGTDPKMAAQQFVVNDVTQNNLRDSGFVVDLMQRVSGVSDNIMGFVNSGGRKSATEVRSSNTLGINRLKVIAEYNSALGWAPYSQTILQETQQRYELERMYRTAGIRSQDPNFQSMLTITPEDIKGFYDFSAVDGTMPIDRFAMAQMQKELMVDTLKIQPIAMQMDYMRWLGYIAELQGARNFERFKLATPQVQVLPDDQVAAQATAGNVVPLGGQNARPGTAQNPGRVPGPAQVPGMGPTQ